MLGKLVRPVPQGSSWRREMTNAFSSMEYPHWLIVAGAALLILGFIGRACMGPTTRRGQA